VPCIGGLEIGLGNGLCFADGISNTQTTVHAYFYTLQKKKAYDTVPWGHTGKSQIYTWNDEMDV
jgi:hypothetical protein